MITAYIGSDYKAWADHLDELAFAYNTATHSSTGMSPAILNYGREPAVPKSLRRATLQRSAEREDLEDLSNWRLRMDGLEELRNSAASRSRDEQDRQARNYDLRRRPTTFKVGDKVWKRKKILSSAAEGVAAKLAPKFVGPFLITKKLGSNTFELESREGKKESPVHSQQLKEFVDVSSRDDLTNGSPLPPREETPDERTSLTNPLPPRESAASPPDCEEPSGEQADPGHQRARPGTKRRGRPRKLPSAETGADSGQRRAQPESKKRRGRPRKVMQ